MSMAMNSIADNLVGPFSELLLAVADDKLMLGHRNSDWTGLAPILEEDIAFSSLSQDNVAHASSLYEVVGKLLGKSADALAFGRSASAYRCASIVEVPDEFNWATAMVRQFFCGHFDQLRYARLAQSAYQPIAELCARLKAEQRVQTEHIDGWIQRLGTGTGESKSRLQTAIEALATMAPRLFEPVSGESELVNASLYPSLANGASNMFDAWQNRVMGRAAQARLELKIEPPDENEKGGRQGVHSQYFNELLDEMCEVYRLEPNAAW